MSKNDKAMEAVGRVANERLEDLIKEALTSRMNESDCEMRFQEFEIAVRKEMGQPILLDVTVYGMAGDTTKDEFATVDKEGRPASVVKGGGSFNITLDDDTVVKFVFHGITNLNATDYLVTYRLA